MTNLSLHSKAGIIKVENGNNPRTPYLHQVEAIRALNEKIDSEDIYEGLIVLPTGERVIIVMGAINALVSRVSGTFIKNNSCIA